MINKLLLLSAIASVTSCTSYNEYKSCDPEKNYIISDPVAMEEYKKLRSTGEVKSYFSEKIKPEKCDDSLCVWFSPKDFDFIERNFSDDTRNGIYTITASKNLTDPNCIEENSILKSRKDRYCYILTKNENDVAISRYKYIFDNSNENYTVIKFLDTKTNKYLYTYSYQIYSTAAIGGPGTGTCTTQKVKHPEYKFNPYSFHSKSY